MVIIAIKREFKVKSEARLKKNQLSVWALIEYISVRGGAYSRGSLIA